MCVSAGGHAQTSAAAAEDAVLMEAIAGGDRQALGTLYDRYLPNMLALGIRMLGSTREAEDLVQDTFLEAWQRAAHYDRSRGSVRAWLMLRTRSRALDRLRARKRRRTVDIDAIEEREAETADPARNVDFQLARQAMQALSDDQRLAMELSYFSGLTMAEIAAKLDTPIGTIKSRMHQAVRVLRKTLGSQDLGTS